MIPWRKYDKDNDDMIIADEDYLITNGVRPLIARYTLPLFGYGYAWTDSVGYTIKGVTHWATINYPEREDTE